MVFIKRKKSIGPDGRVLNNKPGSSAFKQQKMNACEFIPSMKSMIISFLTIGLVFLPIGIVLLAASHRVTETSQRYDLTCPTGSRCNITMNIPKTMKAPVYLYYQLDEYYQNLRRYVKSRNLNQLRGKHVTDYKKLKNDCYPFSSVNETLETVYQPCGLGPRSMFNDTYVLYQNGRIIPMTKQGIAWQADIDYRFKNPPRGIPGPRIIPDYTDEDFIVWMKTASFPRFRKLHRIINEDIQKGQAIINVEANYPVRQFGGQKSVVLSKTNWSGGRNHFLGIAFIVVGVSMLVLGIIMLLKHKLAPRRIADPKYLVFR
ncbi:hypothetical protein SAMD00019534_101170 [Acytostelium subglobosum LB1]|uniref:hypothetical protein n=1 Tax=Acytostelium subglobosum LB1 TaxID=1410327 RepID=UPI000644FC1C|nr:hypothetical protein SAMD00019534_101170 [Acytostelium subglobosum LB1]GAM26942.1 hypothetical protein SAMD00019534_101170 [Acytostelium subglobosum LB1]|eukprot:XP_012750210.1 hypothetical protein SAMD00019534_101170 [Acytostelium subglobosum LB1]